MRRDCYCLTKFYSLTYQTARFAQSVAENRTHVGCVQVKHLDIFQYVAVGQRESGNVFGLPQVAVQAVTEVHHVVFGGVNLSQGGAEGAAPPLEAGLLAAPLLLKPRLLLLLIRVFTQLETLTCIFRPK